MSEQFVPLGSAEFDGAGAVVVLLTTAPTNAGGFGKTLTQIDAALNATVDGSGITHQARCMTFGVEGGTIHVLTTGQTPTATIGVPYAAGTYEWENEAARIHGFKAWVPVGVFLNVEYGA